MLLPWKLAAAHGPPGLPHAWKKERKGILFRYHFFLGRLRWSWFTVRVLGIEGPLKLGARFSPKWFLQIVARAVECPERRTGRFFVAHRISWASVGQNCFFKIEILKPVSGLIGSQFESVINYRLNYYVIFEDFAVSIPFTNFSCSRNSNQSAAAHFPRFIRRLEEEQVRVLGRAASHRDVVGPQKFFRLVHQSQLETAGVSGSVHRVNIDTPIFYFDILLSD